VGISVRVTEYSGQVVTELNQPDVSTVCRLTATDTTRYPLLAGVDEYDDTTFNPRQGRMLIAELEALAKATNEAHLRDVIAELVAAARQLLPAPQRPHHRRLVFLGD
jgi:hypothetical protein